MRGAEQERAGVQSPGTAPATSRRTRSTVRGSSGARARDRARNGLTAKGQGDQTKAHILKGDDSTV